MQIYRRAMSFFWPDFGPIAILILMIFLLVMLGTMQALPMAILIDTVLSPTPSKTWFHRIFNGFLPQNAIAQISAVCFAFILIKAMQDILSLLRSMLNLQIKYNGTVRVRKALYSHLQDLGPAYYKANPQGDAIFRLTNDTYGPFGIFDTIFTSLQASASLIAVSCVMFSRSTPLALFALSMAPLILAANWHFGRLIRRRSLESREVDAQLTTVIQRALSTLGLIQAFGRQGYEQERFDYAVNHSVDASMRLNWQENLYPLAIQTIYGIGQALLLGFGAWFVYRDQIAAHVENGVSYGDLILFISYFNQMLDPLSLVLGFSARVQSSIAASERVFEVLDHRPTVSDIENAIELPLLPREISCHRVRFTYEKTLKPVLSGINIKIPPGQMIAFVGPSGAGKSTMLSLLPRFYDPTGGNIQLDGIDLRQISISSLRRHIAIVSQDNPLVAGTILENIRYGNPDATEVQVKVAALMAGAHEFIELLPHQYQTQIVEGGQNLSGGQRQRIAIARALLAESPILILDEPTSALDATHEEMFMQTLGSLRGDRTIILVTHKLETVAACDQIFVFDSGRIVEHGTHEVLLAANGLYASLLRRNVIEITDSAASE